MRPKLWLTSLLAAAGASEQEIRLTRGIVQNAASERRPPAPPAGPAALLPFRGRCVSTKLGADDLRVCPFANATQTSLAGQEFVLGVFAAWRGRSLVYSDGDVCGAAPRNATVSIRCGAESYGLRDAREPATCTYEATLDVPIDCDVLGFDRVPNDIVALRADLVKAEATALAAVNRAGELSDRLERASCAAAAAGLLDDFDDSACELDEFDDYDDPYESPYDAEDMYDDPYATGEL